MSIYFHKSKDRLRHSRGRARQSWRSRAVLVRAPAAAPRADLVVEERGVRRDRPARDGVGDRQRSRAGGDARRPIGLSPVAKNEGFLAECSAILRQISENFRQLISDIFFKNLSELILKYDCR